MHAHAWSNDKIICNTYIHNKPLFSILYNQNFLTTPPPSICPTSFSILTFFVALLEFAAKKGREMVNDHDGMEKRGYIYYLSLYMIPSHPPVLVTKLAQPLKTKEVFCVCIFRGKHQKGCYIFFLFQNKTTSYWCWRIRKPMRSWCFIPLVFAPLVFLLGGVGIGVILGEGLDLFVYHCRPQTTTPTSTSPYPYQPSPCCQPIQCPPRPIWS